RPCVLARGGGSRGSPPLLVRGTREPDRGHQVGDRRLAGAGPEAEADRWVDRGEATKIKIAPGALGRGDPAQVVGAVVLGTPAAGRAPGLDALHDQPGYGIDHGQPA